MNDHEPGFAQALELERRKRSEALERGDVAGAIRAGREMEERLRTEHTDALLELSRLHALRGDEVGLYSWLHRAVAAGFWDVQRLREDAAFAPYRSEQSFVELIRGAWANGYRMMLDHEERASFQKPDEVLSALALTPGARVAEIGPGSGYFTVRVARALGVEGTVWAHDASQEMLDHLARRLRWEKLTNVELRKVGRDDPELPAAASDLVLCVDVLHYVGDLRGYAEKVVAGLAPGGRVAVVDYRPKPWEERPWGPPPEQQIPRDAVDLAFASAGLAPLRVLDFLPEQYFVIYGRI